MLATYSDVYHEYYFPDFYCKRASTRKENCDEEKENSLLSYSESESISFLQIINWMYTGQLHLHNQTLYPIMKLSKKLQIQELVKKCKQVDEQNITLADLPCPKKFSNVETQYDFQPLPLTPVSPPTAALTPNTGQHQDNCVVPVQNTPSPEDTAMEETAEPRPCNQTVTVPVAPVSTAQTATNSRSVSSDEEIANQVTSSTPHLGTVSSKKTQDIPMEIQVQPEVQPQVQNDVIPYEDQSVLSNTTIATAEQEAQANMYLNEDPMISTAITCAGHSAAQVVPSEDRLIPVTNGYKCLVCRRIFPTELEGLKHVKSTHSKTYHCSQCGRIFNNKGTL